MHTKPPFVVLFCFLTVLLLMTDYLPGKDKKKLANDVCSAANPDSICSGPNICGSATSACEVDIKRSGGDSSSATPNISDAKTNGPFCVKVGTTMTFKSTSKDTGFILDFGASAPFDMGGAIMGGVDRPVSVVAKKPGCYTYSVGACTAGTIYGMCGDDVAQFIVSAK